MFGGTVPEQHLQPADRKEHSDTSSQKSGRGASRGRGRGRGRSAGRGRGQPSGSVRADHQAGQIAPAPAPTAVAAQQATAANERRGRSRRGRGQPPLGSAAPPGHAVTFGSADPSVQREPRPRARPQHRHGAAHHYNQHTDATGRHQQTQDQQLPTNAAADQAQSVLSGPDCVVCCEPIQVVAIGRCNHRAVCERCSLRLIMLYQDARCPLCKTDLDQVVMTYWRDPEPPDWSAYASNLQQLWHKPKWAKSIFVDTQLPAGMPQARTLQSHLQQLSAKACSVCDRHAHRPFPSDAALAKHVREQHKQHLCHICLEAHRSFPLEQPVYPNLDARDQHVAEAHSLCKFCNINFFSGEELWEHIHNHHFTCQLCLRQGLHSHFAGTQDLTDHLRQDHFLCTEDACQDCFIAFSSLRELQDHHREFHSHRMPRWDQSRARHVALADVFPLLAPAHNRPTGPGGNQQRERGRNRGRGQAQNRSRAAPGRGSDTAGQSNRAVPSMHDAPQDLFQAEGGMTMIDDDFPSMSGQTAGPLLANRTANMPQQVEAFPQLSAAATGTASGSDQDQPSQHRPRRHARPLVKVTVKCPCKRQTSHQVVQEGQEPLPLSCNAACAQASRQQQLAGAFGVEDPAHHVSSFDRNRTPNYSPLLLTHAWSNKAWIQNLEAQLAGFIGATGTKRQSLSAMPRHQREVVHALAEQYGLASSSYKQEPQRHVELFKLPTSSVPNKLLSETVRVMTHEDIIACGRAAHGHPLHLTDLRQDVDVDRLLQQWDGQYNTEWQSASDVVVRFSTPQALKEALAALGGGVRGAFRVDRGYAAAASAFQPSQLHAASASASSNQAASAAQQQRDGSNWQTVKGSSSKPRKTDDRNGTRAVPAYASASPLDFQEPWREGPYASGPAAPHQQAAARQFVMPALSEDELPDDWEEAASEPLTADPLAQANSNSHEAASVHELLGTAEPMPHGLDADSVGASPTATTAMSIPSAPTVATVAPPPSAASDTAANTAAAASIAAVALHTPASSQLPSPAAAALAPSAALPTATASSSLVSPGSETASARVKAVSQHSAPAPSMGDVQDSGSEAAVDTPEHADTHVLKPTTDAQGARAELPHTDKATDTAADSDAHEYVLSVPPVSPHQAGSEDSMEAPNPGAGSADRNVQDLTEYQGRADTVGPAQLDLHRSSLEYEGIFSIS